MRLLLVEDEAFIRELVVTLCHERGVEVCAVADGRAAVRVAREQRPDIVLLDIVLPLLDGISVCRLLKSDPATMGVPVYMLSARVRDTLSAHAIRERGVFDAGAVQQLIDQTMTGAVDGSYPLFSLLAFETWCRTMLDTPAAAVEIALPPQHALP